MKFFFRYLKNLNWKELFFPVFYDLKEINDETNINSVSNNAYSLADDIETYNSIIKLIEEKKTNKKSNKNIIIID